jgi:hypothetical protein
MSRTPSPNFSFGDGAAEDRTAGAAHIKVTDAEAARVSVAVLMAAASGGVGRRVGGRARCAGHLRIYSSLALQWV